MPAAQASPNASADEIYASSNVKQVGRLAYRGGTDLEFANIAGRRYVVAGGQTNYTPDEFAGIRIIDVTTPTKPKLTGFLHCNTSQNDIQVRGRYAYVGIDFDTNGGVLDAPDCWANLGDDVGPQAGVLVVDLGNPRRPRAVGFVAIADGAHNTTLHPTKPLLYVSVSELPDRPNVIHVVDVRNPRRPKVVATPAMQPGDTPHEITFNKKGTRAYVASSFTHSLVLDTTNPLAPKVISRISDPAINFHHQADPTPDGHYLLISDELVGAEGNGYCPGGGIHVWDLTVEAAPVKVGAYFIPDSFAETDDTTKGPRPLLGDIRPYRCTAHVMRIAPDGRTLVMGWYSQGAQVLDLSGLPGLSAGAQGLDAGVGIRRLGHWSVRFGDAWSAKMDDRGYIFTGDTQRGMDVLRYVRPKATPGPDPGWLTPAQALRRGLAARAAQPVRTYFCYERISG